jgi:hypothetical protein
MEARLSITELPREIAAITGNPPPSYRKVYERVLDGLIPAERLNGRWFVQESHLPAIAALFQRRPTGKVGE